MIGKFDLFIILLTPFILIYILSFLISKNISEDLKKDNNQYKTIDGLRGISAIFVIIHHSLFSWRYFHFDANWDIENISIIYDKTVSKKLGLAIFSLGNVGVCFFFMITGFLFYDKLIRNNGKINNFDFFVKRFFRIAPLYYFVIFMVFITVFFTGMPDFGTAMNAVKAFSSWLMFNLTDIQTISSIIPTFLVIAGVVWTLAIEWKFYVCIPVISVFTRKKLTSILFVILGIPLVIIMFYLDIISDIRLVLPFFFGMLSCLILNFVKFKPNKLVKNIFSLAAIIIFWYVIFKGQYKNPIIYLTSLGLLFIIISNGNTIFGMLNSKIFIMLGKISYSTYLIHGLILFLINGVFLKHSYYLLNTVISMLVTLIISIFTYYFIEKKGIQYGHKITKSL